MQSMKDLRSFFVLYSRTQNRRELYEKNNAYCHNSHHCSRRNNAYFRVILISGYLCYRTLPNRFIIRLVSHNGYVIYRRILWAKTFLFQLQHNELQFDLRVLYSYCLQQFTKLLRRLHGAVCFAFNSWTLGAYS